MMRVTTLPDGARFEGRDAVEVVYRMMQASYVYADDPDPARYMHHTKKRLRVWNGTSIEFDDEFGFLKALEAAGMVKIEVGGVDDE